MQRGGHSPASSDVQPAREDAMPARHRVPMQPLSCVVLVEKLRQGVRWAGAVSARSTAPVLPWSWARATNKGHVAAVPTQGAGNVPTLVAPVSFYLKSVNGAPVNVTATSCLQ